jgi:hypothetical protein
VGIVQSEVSIWVSGDEVVIGWNDGQGFVDQSSITGYGYSTDRGETWTDGGSMPDSPTSVVNGDPTIVKTNAGTWVMGSINTGTGLGTAINRGTFFGDMLTFQDPIIYVDSGNFLDKEYLDYDPATDTIYLVYVGGGLRLTRSVDDGLTWSSPIVFSNSGHGPYPAPGIDGEVYCTWIDPLGSSNAQVRVRWSPDGGQTFPNPARTVSTTSSSSGTPPRCFNRGFNILFPSADVDRSDGPHRGRVHITWCDGTANRYDIFHSYSDDKGQTWTTPVQINDNDNSADTEQFWPQMRVSDTDGRVVVGWYDRRNDTGGGAAMCDFYGVMSVDGGQTWGPNRRLSDSSVAWCGVPSNISPNFGDYTDITIDDRSVFAVWSDGRNGDPDVVFSRFDDRSLLTVDGEIGLTPADGDGVAWLMANESEIALTPAPPLDNNAELTIAGVGLAMLATPAETEGVFDVSGENLAGSVTLSSSEGNVTGSFELIRTGDSAIDFRFSVSSDESLDDVQIGTDWAADLTLTDAGPNSVGVSGALRLSRFVGALDFSVDGILALNGAQGESFGTTHTLQHRSSFTTGTDLVLHTRTLVEDLGMVDVDDPIVLGPNAFPMFRIGASPNPYQPSTRITYEIDRDVEGAVRVYASTGRLVRTVVEGTFARGEGSIAFDGKDDAGRDLATGVYFVSLETSYSRLNKKLFVVR